MSTPNFSDLFQACIGPARLWSAWTKVRGNGGCSGGDGQTIPQIEPNARAVLAALAEELRSGTYHPRGYRRLDVRKTSGGTRPLAIPSVRDRVAQTAVAQELTPLFEPLFHDDSYGYRPGKSVDQAVRRVDMLRRSGLHWVAEADITRCFEMIPHDPMLSLLAKTLEGRGGAAEVVDLVALWLEHAGQTLGTPGIGLPQGSPLSPLLSNLYLDQLDDALASDNIAVVRFADDFVLLARSRKAAVRALDRADTVLGQHGLTLHSEKCDIRAFDDPFKFLGYMFVRSLVMRSVGDPAEDVFALMRDIGRQDVETAAEKEMEIRAGYDAGPRVLHMQTPGRRIGLSNLSFEVQAREGHPLMTLAHHRVDRIEIGPGVTCAPEVIEHALATDTDLAYVSGAGETLGWLSRPGFDRAGLHLAQARVALDPERAASLARAIVDARLRNMRSRLQVLNRGGGKTEVVRVAKSLGRVIRKLPGAGTVAALRGHEGEAAALYWPALGLLCPEATAPFRRQRPARDPLNASLNYLTALLARDVRAAIIAAGLHPGFGVLHAPSDGNEACVWDMMEAPRAIYAEGIAVALFRRGTLKSEMFTKSGKSVRIAPEGRRALIRAYEAAMERNRSVATAVILP
ncbi:MULTISPECIES: CRISPR-associated endonuclease Cas1 [unclassified Marinovum]